MILGFVFFFIFFFFSRQLICENTSITCIYMRWNNRQILVRFSFCIYCHTYFCFLKLCVFCIWRQSFEHLFFLETLYFCVSWLFFFLDNFCRCFWHLKFSACFSFFFFFSCCYSIVVTIHYFKVDRLKWEKNK